MTMIRRMVYRLRLTIKLAGLLITLNRNRLNESIAYYLIVETAYARVKWGKSNQ